MPLKCGHKLQWITLQYSRRIIAGKRHQSLKSKWQSSKQFKTHRLLSETRRMSSILESPIIQSVRSPPSHPALPRHYCFQLLLRGEHILKSNLNNNYHKQLVGEGGGGGHKQCIAEWKRNIFSLSWEPIPFAKLIDNTRKKVFRHWDFLKRFKLLTITSSCDTAPPSIGSFGIDDGNCSEKVSFKINSRFFNLCRVYSNLLKMASVGEFPWSWFLEDRTQI